MQPDLLVPKLQVIEFPFMERLPKQTVENLSEEYAGPL